MDNMNIVIDTNSITNTKQLMDSECDTLISMINKYKEMFEETKNIYDTDSATIYRKIALGYLDIVESYLKNDFKAYINNLDNVKKTYVNEITTVADAIQGGVE